MGTMISIPNHQQAYLVRPDNEPKAAVLVIHEVWGLTDHIKSIADRLAGEGYLALAPDLLADSGVDVGELSGLQEGLFDPARKSEVQPKLRELMAPISNPEFGAKALAGTKASFDYLYNLPEARQKVAALGFCFGGTYSYSLAVNEPRLKLALPFYGHCNFEVSELAKIRCPVRAFYGQNDEGLAEQMSTLPDKMREAGVDYAQKVYDGCGHAFFNDTNKFAYNANAARDAWRIVLDELAK